MMWKPLPQVLGDGLSELGQTIFTASSGIEAIEIFKTTPVDLVLCDLGMPEMNGWQVASAIKSICAEKGMPKTPFVLITGWDREVTEDNMAAQSGVRCDRPKANRLFWAAGGHR